LVKAVLFLFSFSVQQLALGTLIRLATLLKNEATASGFDGTEVVPQVEQGAWNVLSALGDLLNSAAQNIIGGTEEKRGQV